MLAASSGAPTPVPAPQPLLSVQKLYKHFPVYSEGFFKRQIGTVRASDNVSFDLMPGETLGLVVESGSGKTTTGRTILRALDPTSGHVFFRVNGKTVDLARLSDRSLKPLRLRMQMIFQDPFSSLNPRMTVGDIVSEPLIIHRQARGSELEDRVAEMLKRVGLKPEHRHRYPHAFSGGQRQRIGIARALILRPSFVVCDEAVSALDVSVQAQVINLLCDLQKELGLAYLFIAHDLSVVRHICDRVAVMYAGKIVEIAKTEEIFKQPLHPYTKALLSAVPNPDPDVRMRFDLKGEVADPGNLPPGCAFHPRCAERTELCFCEEVVLNEQKGGRYVACHRHYEDEERVIVARRDV
ncbi:MAG: ATP-binding cassette domain-containing protein [Candidatus Sumerlaeota bacterium]|nr:ATP-binding cassette domain-containing protein [Candidatus Sumerlaeota bacterium]